jgi:hypothetical protein
MIIQKYINDIGNFLLKKLIKINDLKAGLYIIFFGLYFFFYFLITLPKLMKDTDNNVILNFFKYLRSKLVFLIGISIIDIFSLLTIICTLIYYFKNRLGKAFFYFLALFFLFKIVFIAQTRSALIAISVGLFLILWSYLNRKTKIFLVLALSFFFIFDLISKP